MFVQATTSRRHKKTYVSYLVRQSFRTAHGPRSRTVCNISGLPEPVRLLITQALQGKEFADVSSLKLSAALDYGGLAVLREAWQRLGLEQLLGGIPNPRARGLLQAMVLGRILFPCAKLALSDQAQGTALAAACGLAATESFDEDDLYEAMDQLNGRWVEWEKALYADAFADGVRLVLYDLTSVYFEGHGPKGLGRYGYSRDHRGDRPQILLAVATDRQGVPIHLEVLRGNRADNRTLVGLLANLRRRFGIQEAIFVFDGGMSSRFNLQEMQSQQLHYITRLSAVSLARLLAELPRDQQPELWDRTRLVEITHQGKRYVIAGGAWRQQRDAARRAARLAKAEAQLKRLAAVKRQKADAQKLASQVGRMLERLKAHKYFEYGVQDNGQIRWQRKSALIAAEQQQDGWYVLHTDLAQTQCAGAEVVGHYKELLEVEEAFCQLKSYLEVRPVYHWRPDRVRNHVRICFLAYWLSARLGSDWRAQGEKGEVPRLLQQMQTIRVGQLQVRDHAVGRLLVHVPKNLNEVLKKLDLLRLFAQPPDWVPM